MSTITLSESASPSIRITAHDSNNVESGHVFLYIMHNDLHKEPFGYIEDLFVKEEYRKQGVGKELMQKTIEVARAHGCYKLLGTSRHGRDFLHAWYQKLGFEDWGKEFRMNL
jgi:GNAT superfamily N-acetyltransferase